MRTIRDCKVIVVGGAGFLGSHLVNHLIEDRYCKVLVIDNLCAGKEEFIHRGAEFLHHDITLSESYLHHVFSKFKGQYVFNYTAWPFIPDSFERPIAVCDVNFMGAIKVINAAQESGAKGILQVSSAEIYGTSGLHPYSAAIQEVESGKAPVERLQWNGNKISESAPVCPHSSYGVAKAAVDNYVQCAWKERQTPCIALRQFNCVGERETHPYVVPEIISQLFHGPTGGGYTTSSSDSEYFSKAYVKLGNNSFRDFLYAGDQAKIAVELLERGKLGEVYNLGSESGIKIYDLAKLIGKLMGFADVKVEQDPARVRPWEIWHLQSDNTKIKSLWPKGADMPLAVGGWCADQFSLEFALKRTIAYYRENGNRWCWEK